MQLVENSFSDKINLKLKYGLRRCQNPNEAYSMRSASLVLRQTHFVRKTSTITYNMHVHILGLRACPNLCQPCIVRSGTSVRARSLELCLTYIVRNKKSTTTYNMRAQALGLGACPNLYIHTSCVPEL